LPGRRPRLRGAVFVGVVLTICPAVPANAQIAGALSLDSEYRLRGVSLSDQRAAASFSASFEHPGGAYAGGTTIISRVPDGGVRMLGYVAQLGYAFRDVRGTSWDFGVSNTDVEVQGSRRFNLKYSDIHVGVSRDNLSGRIYVSPNYQGSVKTAYLDLNAALVPAESWRISTHLGILKLLGSSTPRVSLRERVDVRVGLAHEIGNVELRLEGVASRSNPKPRVRRSREAIVAGVSLYF
jgi:hypothetical protein